MFRALHTAASGMDAQQTQIDIIANNLANVNSVGFKKSRGEFQDLYYQQVRGATGGDGRGPSSPVGLELGQGVRVGASRKLFTQGDSVQTGYKTDFAIKGEGFFKVTRAEGGDAFTRAGHFSTDPNGFLVNDHGARLDPNIQIPDPSMELKLESDGRITGKKPNDQDFTQLGQLKVHTFQNASGLTSLGGNLFQPTSASGNAIEGTPGTEGFGQVSQGELESSNVKVVEEMIDLIAAQRAYEINSKVIQATDQMLHETTSMR